MYIPNDFDIFNRERRKREAKERKLLAVVNDSAATDGEKEAAKKALKRIKGG